MTETDSGITRGYNAGTRDYDSITRSYNAGTRDDRDEIVITKGYDSITRSYKREREVIGEKEKL